MDVEFVRWPLKRDNLAATYRPAKYPGSIGGFRERDGRYLCIRFETNAPERQSEFLAHVCPEQFQELARTMMRADPEATIRAFGSAIKDFGAQKPAEEAAA